MYASSLFQSALAGLYALRGRLFASNAVDSSSRGERIVARCFGPCRRPVIYRANISQLFFHSTFSLLFSNHRSTSIVPFNHGKRCTPAFSIVPPLLHPTRLRNGCVFLLANRVICRENCLRNVFNRSIHLAKNNLEKIHRGRVETKM